MKTNRRFELFMELRHNVTWENNTIRNVYYINFIDEMVSRYTGCKNVLDPKRRIHDHDDFTKFIEKYVASQLGR